MLPDSFSMVAKTFKGLEPVLAEELSLLGADRIKPLNRAVEFFGDKALMYKANFRLRTALRILIPIARFKAVNEEALYRGIFNIDWDRYLLPTDSLRIDTVVHSERFKHSMFVGMKSKDAIADQFRTKYGKRPSVDKEDATVLIHVHLMDDNCIVSLDSSGESLHRRGYRKQTNMAPLNEVLAAGMLLLAGWKGESDFLDPMCGSGTLPIEAALIARNIPPGVFRKSFGFEKWKDFDPDLLEEIYNDDTDAREFSHTIFGSDIDPVSVKIAGENVKNAGISGIKIRTANFETLSPPENCLVMMNPPYGERMKTFHMGAFYEMIGRRLKHHYSDRTVWLISSHLEALKSIGLKPSGKYTLFNGALECRFLRYEIFKGKREDFRS